MRKSTHTAAYKVLLEHLVAARHESGLSQSALANKIKRPQSFVAKYEGGERRLDVIEFIEIAELIGADVSRIIRAIKNAR